MSDDWYCELGGRQYGPMSFHDLQTKLQGENLRKVFVWCEQFEDWKCAADIPELNPRPRQPPPSSDSAQRRADSQSSPEKKRSSRWKAFGRYLLTVALGLIAAGLSRALGPAFWMPSVLISATWLILAKCKVSHTIIPVLAIVIGHMTWMLIGFSFLYARKGMPDTVFDFGVELVVVAGLSIWTIARQSIPSAVGILLYQLAFLGNMALGGAEIQVGPEALATHILLRCVDVAAAIYAIIAIVRLRRPTAAAS